jgi:hypothetical protein
MLNHPIVVMLSLSKHRTMNGLPHESVDPFEKVRANDHLATVI